MANGVNACCVSAGQWQVKYYAVYSQRLELGSVSRNPLKKSGPKQMLWYKCVVYINVHNTSQGGYTTDLMNVSTINW